ncbi:MAG: hypothetical protein KGI97_06925, partial [Alphaproteobacteria bacterium]|nr:hypothetical protein [Alphaproteobacteria bacterium]
MDLTIITETGDGLVSGLRRHNITGGHFTNGTYAPPKDLIVPTVLAGFQQAVDEEGDEALPLVIAVNSDVSMAGIMDKKKASAEERAKLESQTVRAAKVAFPLSLQNPTRP